MIIGLKWRFLHPTILYTCKTSDGSVAISQSKLTGNKMVSGNATATGRQRGLQRGKQRHFRQVYRNKRSVTVDSCDAWPSMFEYVSPRKVTVNPNSAVKQRWSSSVDNNISGLPSPSVDNNISGLPQLQPQQLYIERVVEERAGDGKCDVWGGMLTDPPPHSLPDALLPTCRPAELHRPPRGAAQYEEMKVRCSVLPPEPKTELRPDTAVVYCNFADTAVMAGTGETAAVRGEADRGVEADQRPALQDDGRKVPPDPDLVPAGERRAAAAAVARTQHREESRQLGSPFGEQIWKAITTDSINSSHKRVCANCLHCRKCRSKNALSLEYQESESAKLEDNLSKLPDGRWQTKASTNCNLADLPEYREAVPTPQV